MLKVRSMIKGKFPVWIATNWGSDIYLFGKLPEHQQFIRAVMQSCDYYSCECERDIQLAREMGFQGKVLPVLPNAGGVHIKHEMSFRQPGPVSKRKTIILKGYQNWAGRALVAFQAFRRCQDALQGYTINVYSASEDVKIAAQLFAFETGIAVNVVQEASHKEILKLFGKSRIYIGLSISDGISTSLLEAMIMGAFPIQSCTACAGEWIEDGRSGFIVPPEEPYILADAIRKALVDDSLVDHAAEINAQTVAERLDYSIIQAKIIKMYRDIYDSRKE
jgi:glycosyltransferase involved in cell wall biosynthesis